MPNLSLPRIKCPPKSINSLIRNIAKCVLAEVKRIDLELRKCEVGNNNFPNYRPSRLVDAKWRKSVVPKSTHPCSWSGLRLTETNLKARYAEKEGQTVQITGFPMHESYITFRNALYQGTSEAAMDKSPLLCEIFKKSLENNLAEVGRLLEILDQICERCTENDKGKERGTIFEKLNQAYRNIEFTMEIEIIPERMHFEFDNYRKPTQTQWTITCISNHDFQQARWRHTIS